MQHRWYNEEQKLFVESKLHIHEASEVQFEKLRYKIAFGGK